MTAPRRTHALASVMSGDAPEQFSGARLLLKALEDQGVEVIFGYPGGAVLPIYDEIFKQNRIRHVLVRHEQAAVHAAEGYARSTGRVGCVLVTSGPGATNAVTGLADALLDSIPLVCITGQVATHLIGNDAFQEADTVGITRPCTKHNYLVKDAAHLARTVHEAFYVARAGRPGPVVVDLPKDVMVAMAAYSEAPAAPQTPHKTYRPKTRPDADAIAAAVELMATARRPLLYTGGGVINSGPRAVAALRELAELTGFPVTSTLMGLGAYPAAGKAWLGMVGMHGLYEANLAMHGCDLMICVGARFDDRVTGNLKFFSPGSRKIHIDIDPSSINKNVMVDVPVVADCGLALEALVAAWRRRTGTPKLDAWWREIDGWRARDCLRYDQESATIKPQYAIERLYALTHGRNPVITTEVGQHQMWAAQFYRFEEPQRWITSGGLGTMGFGLPAAIGAQIAEPDALVIDIAGEASLLMNIQELSTAIQHNANVKVFCLNNRYMGMVRQWQELLHGGRYSHSYSEALPDFVKLADAFGCAGLRVTRPEELDGAIRQMMAIDKPVICEVLVDPAENCFPMIPAGGAHNDMILSAADKTPAPDSEGRALV